MTDDTDTTAVELATELTITWLGNHNTRVHADDVPAFLARMHEAVTSLSTASTTDDQSGTEAPAEHTPAVSVRKSLGSKDHIISMIDGKPYKTLRRHLSSNGLTPDEYRARYNLKADYPMVAESYSHHRREMAKRIGLGRKPGASVQAANQDAPVAAAAMDAPKRGRRKAAAAAAE